MNRLLFASAALYLIFLASCGASGAVTGAGLSTADPQPSPRGVFEEDPQPDEDPNPEGWAVNNVRLPLRSGGDYAIAWDYPGSPGFNVDLGHGGWAIFAWDPLPGKRVACAHVRSLAPPPDVEPGVFWVALEHKLGARWEIYGPYSAGESPAFGDSHPEFEPGFFWWFKGNTRVAVWCTEETSFRGVDFWSKDK